MSRTRSRHGSRPRAAAAARLRLARASILGASLGVSAGCYTARPLIGAPDAGVQAVVTLNDRGRVLLGEALGPNADRVEGQVVDRSDSAFVLAVRNVRYVGGQANEWKSERVSVPVAGVRGIEEHRFSRARTWALAGAIGAALLALILTRSIFGDDPTLVDQGGGGPQQGT